MMLHRPAKISVPHVNYVKDWLGCVITPGLPLGGGPSGVEPLDPTLLVAEASLCTCPTLLTSPAPPITLC